MKRLDLSDNALTGQLAGLDTTHMEVGQRLLVAWGCGVVVVFWRSAKPHLQYKLCGDQLPVG
jgi:hypothetical protein